MINFAQIQPQLYIGTYPQNTLDINRLKSGPRITAVLNLQSDADFAVLGIDWPKLNQTYMSQDMMCQRWPMIDFDREDVARNLEGAVNILDQLIGVGHRVYVHCTAGLNRAPSVAITYLVWNHAMGLKEAFEYVTLARYCEPYLDAIRTATENRQLEISTKHRGS